MDYATAILSQVENVDVKRRLSLACACSCLNNWRGRMHARAKDVCTDRCMRKRGCGYGWDMWDVWDVEDGW
jgi:hypothetical protein